MHSLDKFLTGDLLFAVLIQLIDKLRTVRYHLVHGHLLGEMTILEAILAMSFVMPMRQASVKVMIPVCMLFCLFRW